MSSKGNVLTFIFFGALFVFLSDRFTSAPTILLESMLCDFSKVTSGEIVRSEVVLRGKYHNKRLYNIEYSFIVDGRSFIGKRVGNALKTENPDESVEKYYLGRVVSVNYDMDNPNCSILEPGVVGIKVYLEVFLALLYAFLIYIAFFVFSYKSNK